MNKAISISVNPNIEDDDLTGLFSNCLGESKKLKNKIEEYFGKEVELVEKGRDGLNLVMKALNLNKGDEVVIQAFTCSVVPMAILNAGLKVVYVDIDKNFNIDLTDLKNKCSDRTRVVVVQHTFGMPVDINKVRETVGKKVVIIEDLAHGLGNSFDGKKLGMEGDVAVLSFGRDKVITGVWGGAVVANSIFMEKIRKMTMNLPCRNNNWVKKQINYILWSEWSLRSYGIGIGKIMHWLAKTGKWFEQPLSDEEKSGKQKKMHQGIPDKLAMMINRQWDKMEKFIMRRKEIAKRYANELGGEYNDNCSYLRYSIEVNDPNGLRKFASQKNIFLGDWYDQVIAPKSVNPEVFGYTWGSCPQAEIKSRRVINLPTCPRLTDHEVTEVIRIIKQWNSK